MKELKELYTAELRKAWSDEKMVRFCSNNTAAIIECNGKRANSLFAKCY